MGSDNLGMATPIFLPLALIEEKAAKWFRRSCAVFNGLSSENLLHL
jgi:hypothetical protein